MSHQQVTGASVGMVRAVITRANGDVEDLGVISLTSVRWWQVRKRLVLRAMRRTEY